MVAGDGFRMAAEFDGVLGRGIRLARSGAETRGTPSVPHEKGRGLDPLRPCASASRSRDSADTNSRLAQRVRRVPSARATTHGSGPTWHRRPRIRPCHPIPARLRVLGAPEMYRRELSICVETLAPAHDRTRIRALWVWRRRLWRRSRTANGTRQARFNHRNPPDQPGTRPLHWSRITGIIARGKSVYRGFRPVVEIGRRLQSDPVNKTADPRVFTQRLSSWTGRMDC